MKKMKFYPLPQAGPWPAQDPFIFCAYHEDDYPKGEANLGPAKTSLRGRQMGSDFNPASNWRMYHGQEIPGFPYHPHRGFETLTIVEKGWVDHTDSHGGAGRYSAGDLQWLTAGRGLLHSEMFPLVEQEKENPLRLFQIWLNLPSKQKMVDPQYKMFWSHQLVEKEEQGARFRLWAGQFGPYKAPEPPAASWASQKSRDFMVLRIDLEAGAKFTIPKASSTESWGRLYLYEGGDIQANGQKMPLRHYMSWLAQEELELVAGPGGAKLLYLQAPPIEEPVWQRGPFVMDSSERLQEAFKDYRAGKFGKWPWPEDEHHFGPKKERFARHADGREERLD
ncbi:Pirin-related protein [Saprospira grandis DSM 2844]|uniref:Pirin-related protein n=1 Tax=Saprospira grandis DSM 2844 TaxID=694433 RepID=J0Y004_9BACT|nr:pirin family protein [Saprospira grandis]EJF54831.1 Pirin-related protein [Saprospira grandis DSM 2844]